MTSTAVVELTLGDTIANIIYAGAFVELFAFMILYALRSAWNTTPAGRALLFTIAALNLIVLQSTVHQFTGRYPFIWLTREVTGTLIFLAAGYLLIVLLRLQEPITLATFWTPRETRRARRARAAAEPPATPPTERIE